MRLARYGLSLGLLGLTLAAAPALAIEGIGVSPTSQEVTVDPGKTIAGQLTVINDGNTDITYKVNVSDYQVVGEKYQGTFNSTGAERSISPVTWFTLPVGNAVVKAGQQIKVPYSITAPQTATPGGHYAAVFIETVPPATPGATVIHRVQKIGSLFYIAVSGDLIRNGEALGLTAPLLQLHPPITANLRVKNTGNVHFPVDGQSYLTNLFGHKYNPVTFHGEVLPQTTRDFPLSLPTSSEIGIYKVTSEATFLDRTQTFSRWVVLVPPITLAVVSFTIILLASLLVVGLVRKRKRKI